MKKVFLFYIALIFFSACNTPTEAEKHANVILIEGPIFEDGYTIFFYKGRVRNDGEIAAKFSKIYFYIRDSGNNLLAQEWTFIDDDDLTPGETSAFDVLFSDDGHSIRDRKDDSKMTYEIKWDE